MGNYLGKTDDQILREHKYKMELLQKKTESNRELLKEKRELLKEKSESDREVARIAADATT